MKRFVTILALIVIPLVGFAQKTDGTPNAHLNSRTVLGTLPRPSYAVQSEGTVVVTIWVDQYGTVQKAVAGASGTTVTDSALWQEARKAALGAHFNISADAPALQEGTITYHFKLPDSSRRISSTPRVENLFDDEEETVTLFDSSFPSVMSDIMVLNAASDSRDDDYFFSEEQYWKYIWDLPLSFFDTGAIIVNEVDLETGKGCQINVAPDDRGIYIDGGTKMYLYQRAILSHKELLGARSGGIHILVEPSLDEVYCNSYTATYRNELEKPSLRPYKYCVFNSEGLLSEFSMEGFSGDEIIESSRTIVPNDPWVVTYDDIRRVKSIVKDDVKIEFEWENDYVGYRRTFSRARTHYNVHGIKFSDYDELRRWTKAVLYDYDVVLNKMKPVQTISRRFVQRSSVTQGARSPIYASSGASSTPIRLVDEKPSFNGGDANEFSKWVHSHIVYPDIAKQNGVQGLVTLQYTVNADGSISNVKVLRGIDPSLDKEAVRVVSSSPKWKPGMKDGKPVKVTYTFPVFFQL